MVLAACSFDCGTTLAAFGATDAHVSAQARRAWHDVRKVFGDDIASLLSARHPSLFSLNPEPSDAAMIQLERDLWTLATLAAAQTAGFSQAALAHIDRRLRSSEVLQAAERQLARQRWQSEWPSPQPRLKSIADAIS